MLQLYMCNTAAVIDGGVVRIVVIGGCIVIIVLIIEGFKEA